jgi:hypothetical protein
LAALSISEVRQVRRVAGLPARIASSGRVS